MNRPKPSSGAESLTLTPGIKGHAELKTIADLAKTYHFAAVKHVNDRRKGAASEPYMNHLTEVADLVATATGGTDIELVMAAVLHDTVEDTPTTFSELEEIFGGRVASLVGEVTDDKTLLKAERKRLQIEHAAHASPDAKIIKLADKIANLHALAASPPTDWPAERIGEYVRWAGRVVEGCRGANASLVSQFDEAFKTFTR